MSATEARPMFRPPIVVCSALPGDFETVPEARAAWEAAGQPGALNDPRGMVWAARYVWDDGCYVAGGPTVDLGYGNPSTPIVYRR